MSLTIKISFQPSMLRHMMIMSQSKGKTLPGVRHEMTSLLNVKRDYIFLWYNHSRIKLKILEIFFPDFSEKCVPPSASINGMFEQRCLTCVDW